MELAEAYKVLQERRIKRMSGRTTTESGILAYTDQWQQNLSNLPVNATFRRILQDPATGKPYFVAGIHTLGASDNAGFAPPGSS